MLDAPRLPARRQDTEPKLWRLTHWSKHLSLSSRGSHSNTDLGLVSSVSAYA